MGVSRSIPFALVAFVAVVTSALLGGCAPSSAARLPPSAAGTTPTQVDGFLRELTKLDVTLADGSTASLETLITRPAEPVRVPLVILIHGTPRDASERETMSPTGFAAQSLAFGRRGYGVAVVMRRGYGRSSGTYGESSGKCENKDYIGATRISADDVLGALHALQGESWVDPERVLLVGQSTGGFAVLAAGATNPKGVVGVVSFAGGRGSDVPDHICRPDRLIDAARDLGSTARVPSLWIYAQNDHFFAPFVAEQLAQAYTGAGGLAELVTSPAFGDDGHLLFSRGTVDLWWRYVAPFLTKRGLPTETVRARTVPALAPPPHLARSGQVAFGEYLASESFEKAFAAGSVAWGWAGGRRTRAEAAETALHRCREHGKDCVVYAVGDGYAR
ncbi:MAG: alpha/beta hydrolase family protein [Polyangiaceae bacterium]